MLADIVTENKLPPKVLVVHRFTRKMLTNTDSIRLDPRVQVVIQMDGFGSPGPQAGRLPASGSRPIRCSTPASSCSTRTTAIARTKAAGFEPSCDQVTYELVGCGDDGLMTPEQVIGRLYPVPLYIQYQ